MLSTIISLISAMNYDELKDCIDYIEYYFFVQLLPEKEGRKFSKQVRSRRTGIPTGGFPYTGFEDTTKLLEMTTPAQREIKRLYVKLSKSDQTTLFGKPSLNRDESGAIAWALLKSKMPIRKTSKGNIQVKWIPYKYIVRDEKGLPMKDGNGKTIVHTTQAPYLYLRYWQVHGDSSKRKRRVKSIYIGGQSDFRDKTNPLESYEYPYRALAHLFKRTTSKHFTFKFRMVELVKMIRLRLHSSCAFCHEY